MIYLYRRGNGNDGNYERNVVEVSTDPYKALKALVCNDYIAGSNTRKHIQKELQIDGEADFSIYGTVFEGPKGETDFGAAWLTAELNCLDGDDLTYYRARREIYKLEDLLDEDALRILNGA